MCIFTENFIRLFLEKMIIFKQRSVANINYFTQKNTELLLNALMELQDFW